MSSFKKTIIGVVKVDPLDVEDGGTNIIAELADGMEQVGDGPVAPEGEEGLWLQLRSSVDFESLKDPNFKPVGTGKDRLRFLQFHPEMQAIIGKKVKITIEEID